MSTVCTEPKPPVYRHFPLQALLERIRDFPFLYDRRCPEYRDTALKDDRLKVIAAEFGITDEECKKKWRNARDRCMKIRQKLDAARRSGCGGKDVRRPYWCHYSLLDSMLEDTSPAHLTNSSHISSTPTITNAWTIHMDTDGVPEVIEGASNSTTGRSTGSASCDDDENYDIKPTEILRHVYSEEVPETEGRQPCKFDEGHSREDAEIGETFNGNACHGDQPRARAAPRRKGPTVDPSPRSKRRSCEPPDTDPLARSVKDALERCSAALSGLPDRPGHERDDYCDIEATWIASKLKIFPRSHRCRVAHKIHCIIHEEEMKLYE